MIILCSLLVLGLLILEVLAARPEKIPTREEMLEILKKHMEEKNK